jgi:hypothetical protein
MLEIAYVWLRSLWFRQALEKRNYRSLRLAELPCKEVIGPFDPDERFWLRQSGIEFLQASARSVNIFSTLNNQFRLGHSGKKTHIRRADGHSQTDQRSNARVRGAHGKSHPASKRKTHQDDRQIGESRAQEIERGANIVALADAFVERACTLADSAEVEPQRRCTHADRRLRGSKHNLGVHRAAKERMRVANQHCHSRLYLRHPFQQRLKRSGRPGNHYSFDTCAVGSVHRVDRRRPDHAALGVTV